MATFTEIYYNGNEYKQMWLNGTKVWEKSGGIIYPYPNVDSVVTYKNTNTTIYKTFKIIDSTLPYLIDGVPTNENKFVGYSTSKIKLVNLNPSSASDYLHLISIEQLRIPKLTDLSHLFQYLHFYTEGQWQPQYFEFHPNPTNMSYMFYYCSNLTDEKMAQFMPYFPNTSSVTDMSSMFKNCSSLTS